MSYDAIVCYVTNLSHTLRTNESITLSIFKWLFIIYVQDCGSSFYTLLCQIPYTTSISTSYGSFRSFRNS